MRPPPRARTCARSPPRRSGSSCGASSPPPTSGNGTTWSAGPNGCLDRVPQRSPGRGTAGRGRDRNPNRRTRGRSGTWETGSRGPRTEDFEAEPFVVVLSTRMDGPGCQVQAGQALQRVLLTATALGLTASFLSQPIEVNEQRRELRRLLADGRHPQAVVRLGFRCTGGGHATAGRGGPAAAGTGRVSPLSRREADNQETFSFIGQDMMHLPCERRASSSPPPQRDPTAQIRSAGCGANNGGSRRVCRPGCRGTRGANRREKGAAADRGRGRRIPGLRRGTAMGRPAGRPDRRRRGGGDQLGLPQHIGDGIRVTGHRLGRQRPGRAGRRAARRAGQRREQSHPGR